MFLTLSYQPTPRQATVQTLKTNGGTAKFYELTEVAASGTETGIFRSKKGETCLSLITHGFSHSKYISAVETVVLNYVKDSQIKC